MRSTVAVFLSSALVFGVAGCSVDRSRSEGAVDAVDLRFERVESVAVHPLLRLDDALYTGAEPKTDQAFAALEALGVRTIVSVDGATPKVDVARAHGMDYVQIPIGYDGIDEEQALAMVRVVRERPGPYYFHCHHGRHRGPAAAAIALRALRHLGPDAATEVLTTAGTSDNYPGLWHDVVAFEEPPADAVLPQLVAVATIPDLAAGMARLDRTWDEMKVIKAAEWAASAEHPDLDPHQVAKILRQSFQGMEAAFGPDLSADPIFVEEWQAGLDAARALEEAMEGGDADAAKDAFADVAYSCKSCHADYRNG